MLERKLFNFKCFQLEILIDVVFNCLFLFSLNNIRFRVLIFLHLSKKIKLLSLIINRVILLSKYLIYLKKWIFLTKKSIYCFKKLKNYWIKRLIEFSSIFKAKICLKKDYIKWRKSEIFRWRVLNILKLFYFMVELSLLLLSKWFHCEFFTYIKVMC